MPEGMKTTQYICFSFSRGFGFSHMESDRSGGIMSYWASASGGKGHESTSVEDRKWAVVLMGQDRLTAKEDR